MKIPTTLRHKPVITSEDYDKIDGRYSGDSEAKGLSLGLAQWNDRGRVDISAKVWRYSSGRWSNSSEELPMHRVIDLAILICKAKQYFDSPISAKQYEKNPSIGIVTYDEGEMDISVCTDNLMISEDIRLFRDALANDPYLAERLKTLTDIIKND